jgi:hypothetical protein
MDARLREHDRLKTTTEKPYGDHYPFLQAKIAVAARLRVVL